MAKAQDKSLPNERWLPVVGYEGIYDVSDHGRVRRILAGQGAIAGKILKWRPDTKGYPQVHLCRDGRSRNSPIHRLVAAAFIGPCPSRKEINHSDGIKANNAVENLKYVTHVQNSQHASKMGLLIRGEKVHCAKLTEEDVHSVRRVLGIETEASIAKRMGVGKTCINSIATGHSWHWLKEKA